MRVSTSVTVWTLNSPQWAIHLLTKAEKWWRLAKCYIGFWLKQGQDLILQEIIIDYKHVQACLTQKTIDTNAYQTSIYIHVQRSHRFYKSFVKHSSKPSWNWTILHPCPCGAHRKTDFFWSTKAVKQGAPPRLYVSSWPCTCHLVAESNWTIALFPSSSSFLGTTTFA